MDRPNYWLQSRDQREEAYIEIFIVHYVEMDDVGIQEKLGIEDIESKGVIERVS